jgi:Ca2+-binding RTX toxin-like protein
MRFTGTVFQTAAALKSLTYLHSSSSFSDTRIDISVQSKTSTVSKSIPLTAANGVTAKVPDIGHPSSGRVSLIIHGTPGADTVVVTPLAGSKTDFRVTVNNVSSTVRGITGRFIVGGLGGDDNINLSAVGIAARVDGGDGNDVIQTSSGQDILFGGNGADLIAGGLGADGINGGAGNDIVIDGTVAVRAAGKTLRSVLNGWAAKAAPAESDYASITADLLFTADKASKDALTGGLGTDWFWSATAGAVADVLDRSAIERRRLI